MLNLSLAGRSVVVLFVAVLGPTGCGDDGESSPDSEMQKRIEEAEARCEEARASGCWPGDEYWDACVKVYADLCNPGVIERSCPAYYHCGAGGSG